MKLIINGEMRDLGPTVGPFNVHELLACLGVKADRVAVELNLDIVPRDRWSATTLHEGDRLELVHFVGGGSPPASGQELC